MAELSQGRGILRADARVRRRSTVAKWKIEWKIPSLGTTLEMSAVVKPPVPTDQSWSGKWELRARPKAARSKPRSG